MFYINLHGKYNIFLFPDSCNMTIHSIELREWSGSFELSKILLNKQVRFGHI